MNFRGKIWGQAPRPPNMEVPPLGGQQTGKEIFLFGKFESISRFMWISSCKKIYDQKVLNMDETCDFVIRRLFKI